MCCLALVINHCGNVVGCDNKDYNTCISVHLKCLGIRKEATGGNDLTDCGMKWIETSVLVIFSAKPSQPTWRYKFVSFI